MQNHILSPETLTNFQSKFGTLHDAILHNVEFQINNSNHNTYSQSLTITMETRYRNEDGSTSYGILSLEIGAITLLVIEKTSDDFNGLINRARIEFIADKLYINFFGGFSDPAGTPKAYGNNINSPKGTQLTVAGTKCKWQIEKIKDF